MDFSASLSSCVFIDQLGSHQKTVRDLLKRSAGLPLLWLFVCLLELVARLGKQRGLRSLKILNLVIYKLDFDVNL